MIGSWKQALNCIEIDISATQQRAVICGIFSDNFKKEFEVFKITGAGAEQSIAKWDNCDPNKRSIVMTLETGFTYRIRPRFINQTCGNGTPANITLVPDVFDNTAHNPERITYYEWNFGTPIKPERAGLTIMLVDNNMGGKATKVVHTPQGVVKNIAAKKSVQQEGGE